jgi:uncharacterized FAD-dependent dehydrogenase
LKDLDARIVNTQHDEIIVEARDGIEDQVKVIVNESMKEALERIISEVPFMIEPKTVDVGLRCEMQHSGKANNSAAMCILFRFLF